MSPHQIIAVAVRLFAVWIGVTAVVNTLGVMQSSGDAGGPSPVPPALAALAVFTAVATALWFFPQTVARKLLTLPPGDPVAAESRPISESAWIAVGCTLIGLWLVSRSMPALASFLLILWHYDAPFGDAQDVAERLVYLVLEILFAAWLVLGAPGLPALLAWARRAGLRPPF